MQSLKRYGTETQYSTALANNQFVNNQITLTNDDDYVHFLFQNYEFSVELTPSDSQSLTIEANTFRMYMLNGSSLSDFTDTEFDVLMYGDKHPVFRVNGVDKTVSEINYYTQFEDRFWDYTSCVNDFFGYTALNSSQPLHFIQTEGFNEMLEITLNDDSVLTLFRKPSDGGNHTRIVLIEASVEQMYSGMYVLKTTHGMYSRLAAVRQPANTSVGYTASELSLFVNNDLLNIATSSGASTTEGVANFDEFRYFTGVTDIFDGEDGEYSFCGNFNDNTNSLQHIIFPKTLTTIGYFSFYNCENLTEIKFPISLRTIRANAFYNCGIEGDLKLPKFLRVLGGNAFSDSYSITAVTIPNFVTSLGEDIFAHCTNLTTLNVGYSSATITANTFGRRNNITTITVDERNRVYDSRNDCNAIIETSSDTVLFGCKGTVIPNDIVRVGNESFSDCNGLTNISVPASVTSIGQYAFSDSSDLTSISLSDGLTTIEKYAFASCTSLSSITIPNTVTSIGEYAFYYADLSENVTLSNSITTLASSTFYYSGITSIVVPNSVTSIGSNCFTYCSNLQTVTIGTGVTSINASAFRNCTSFETLYYNAPSISHYTSSKSSPFRQLPIQTLVVGDNVRQVPNYLMCGCSSLYTVTIGSSVTTIGIGTTNYVFSNCSSLHTLYYNAPSVSNYSRQAPSPFYNKSFVEVVFGNTVTSIPQYLLRSCTKLTTVTVGSSVTTIGNYVFFGCSALNTITSLRSTAPSIGSSTFRNVGNNGVLYRPAGSNYSTWMSRSNYYLGKYGWTQANIT